VPHETSDYQRTAARPTVGSVWVWMREDPPVVVRVTQVRWDGEEWRIGTRIGWGDGGTAWNDLTVFWEQCHAIAPHPGAPGARPEYVRRGSPYKDEMELPQ
jgi:hypothetical protein